MTLCIIEIIHKFCNDTETHPKDLVIQWNLQRPPIIFAQDRNGQIVYMQLFERTDRVVEAIHFCAIGHEDKFDKFLEAQEAVFAKYRELAGETAEGIAPAQAPKPGKEEPPAAVKPDWHQLSQVGQIMAAFPLHPTADDIIDLYQKNKTLRSKKLDLLLRKHSAEAPK
jgi:hypothetical protein